MSLTIPYVLAKEEYEIKRRDELELDAEYLKFHRFQKRLCKNNPITDRVFTRRCSSCGEAMTNIVFKNGSVKPFPIIVFCQSPLCNDEKCVDHRLKAARLYYEKYFYSKKGWGKKSLWLHYVLGFPLVSKDDLLIFNKEVFANHRLQINLFMKKIKRLYPSFKHVIGVRDISYNSQEQKFYIHYHIATRFFKGYHNCLTDMNKVSKDFGFKFNLMKNKNKDSGKRSASALINYFAKRKAGLFGDVDKNNTWKFQDYFDDDEYYQVFNKTFSVIKTGWTKEELHNIKINFMKDYAESLENPNAEGVDSLDIRYVVRRDVCSCGCKSSIFARWDYDKEGDPPPLGALVGVF